MTRYAELQVTTNFSFLRGGAHPEELALTAAALGLEAIGVTDRNSLAGVVRAHGAAKEAGIRLVAGARLDLEDASGLLVWPTDRAAYGRLSRLITLGRRRAPKGECRLTLDDVAGEANGQIMAVVPPDVPGEGFARELAEIKERLGCPLHLAASALYRGAEERRIAGLAAAASEVGLPLLATNDVLYHTPARRPVQDVLTCIREGVTIDTAGWRLETNAERHLKSAEEMARLFRRWPDAVARTVEVARACRFSLDELRYEYPDEVSAGGDPQAELERLTWIGAAERYPEGLADKVRVQLVHELTLIAQLRYAPYFLTVHDIVRFARRQGILCQGRGSAANSAVCYVLGITAVDPSRADLLFERFVSPERNEPPDIDVDFEHERREEVIQYIYSKYGRDRAGLTATVICYRARGAIREVGKALGLSVDTVGKLAETVWGWGNEGVDPRHAVEAGLDPADPTLGRAIALAREIIGFPRHLSQHVGGFVISRGPLSELVPIENAAMEDRTVIEWDKDDLDRLGILKVDVLALGMLSCIRRGFAMIEQHYGRGFDLATVPSEDPAVYDMLCRADSLGVFQVESRAQMTMLPRLKPRAFYDLVIEVAIVRPGPIQGDMVHPYLRRRNGEEAVEFPSEELRRVLGKTLGVPLFQEQAMKIAIVAAGFSPSEADKLRRAMATFKKLGDIHKFRDKMVEGMVSRGYERDFAERCFRQIEGFGTYGFPESHAASFALLVYVSAWIKRYYPDVFCAALLNSQPMGFYAPAQIVRDAREHGVEIRPPDVNRSGFDATLEALPDGRGHAVRLGLRSVKGLAEEAALRLVAVRDARGSFTSVRALRHRAALDRRVLEQLAHADAFRSIGLDRRAASWEVRALGEDTLPLFAALEREVEEATVTLPRMTLGEQVVHDYRHLSLTLKAHPVGLMRGPLERDGFMEASRLATLRHGAVVRVAGLVLVRQRPGSAKGVIFVTLEDETGVANLVVMPPVFERWRRELLAARLLGAVGRVEKVGAVIHVKVDRLVDLSDRLLALTGAEPDQVRQAEAAAAAALARADEVRRPQPERKEPRQRAKPPADEAPELQKARSFR